MKRYSLLYICMLLIVATSSIMPAQAQQQGKQYALYNYRNDGNFNAWLNIDVDSITYSRIDTLGVEHDDVVVQEVWTPDSLYRIPLEAIDSIGFRAPEPVFKRGVFHITEAHCPYVIETDSLSISFSPSIPFSMLPQRGQIVISDVYGKKPFEAGFAGKVKNIDSNNNMVKITCDEVSLDDIYDQIICIGRTITYSNNDSTQKARAISINKDGTLEVELLPVKIKLKDPTVESSDMSINLDITPSMTIDYTIVYNVEGMDNQFKIIAKPELDFDIDFKYKSKIFGDKILKMEESFIPINTTIPGLYAKLKWGGFFDYEGNLSVDGKLSYKSVLNVGYDSAKEDYYGFVFNNDGSGWEEPDVSVSLNGYVFFGPAFQLVACLVSEKWLPSFTITAKPGCKLSGKFEINDDMFTGEGVSVYDALKNTKVSCSGELSIEGEAKVFSEEYDLPSTEWKPDWLKQEFFLFPEFSEAALLDMSEIHGNDYSPSFLYSEVSRNLFAPCKIGMEVYDLDGNKVRENFNNEKYWFEKDWGKPLPEDKINRVGVNMNGLPTNNIYKVIPVVQSVLPLINDLEQASPTTYFQIPLPLELEQKTLDLGVGQGKEVSIYRGWGDYRVLNMSPDVVSTQLLTHELESGVKAFGVFVEAKKSGHAFVIVQDIRSNEQVTLSVSVANAPVNRSTIAVSPTKVDFGEVAEGQQATRQFMVKNTGNYDLTFAIAKAQSPFEIPGAGEQYSLAAGASKTFEAICTGFASNIGSKSQFIHINSDAQNADAALGITLTASSVGAAISSISVEPSSIDFGAVEYGTTKTKELRVSNTGNKSLTFHVSYQGGEAFSVSDNGKEYTLNPGDFKIYIVTCHGMMQGNDATGEIQIVSSAESGNQTVRLAAQGAHPTTFMLEQNAAEVKVGSIEYVTILYGGGKYTIANTNPDIVNVLISNENSSYPYGQVKLIALDAGQSVVKLTDRDSNKTINLTVTVKEDDSPYITFADAEVERLCLENWDANGDGRLSKAEAAAVTSLGGVFMRNSRIRSFAEFRYFTGVEYIDLDFYNCRQLRDIVFPKSLTGIYWNTFYDCRRLSSIHIPENVSYIDPLAFQWSNSVEYVTVATSNSTYDSRGNCNAIIKSETNTINNGFYTTVVPSTVTAIGTDAFWGQDRLSELSLPSSITEIGDGAFGFCDLKEITLPSSVVNIGGGAFGGCYNLKRISVEAGNSVYDSREECNAIINSHTNELMQGCQNTTIPSSVTSIADGAFEWQYNLREVTLPDNIKSIGHYAFYECSRLQKVYIPTSVADIGTGAFGGCTDLQDVIVSSQNPKYDSRNNSNSIVETATNTLIHANKYSQIPDDITTIAANALAGYDASSLSLPEGVVYIGSNAFRGCKIEKLTLPSTIEEMGGGVFWECEDLNDVTCYAKEAPYVNDKFDYGDFTFNASDATLHVPAASVGSYSNAQYWSDFGSIMALPMGYITVNPMEIDFGVVELGTDNTKTFTVTNTGDGPLSFKALGDPSFTEYFEVVGSGEEYTLLSGASKDILVTSHGRRTSVEASTDVIFLSDAENDAPVVKLSMVGMDTDPLVAETSITLQVGEEKTIEVRTDNYEISNNAPSVVEASHGGGTTVSGLGELGDYNFNSHSSSSTGHIQLKALTVGSSTIIVTDKASGQETTIVISVTKPTTIKVEPKSIDFGVIPKGSSKTEYLTVSNSGEGTLHFHLDYSKELIKISDEGKEFILEPGKSEKFSVVCSIPEDCSFLGGGVAIWIRSDASNADEYALVNASYTVGEPSNDVLSVSPKEIDFGTVELGTDKTETFTVTNSGGSEMVFSIPYMGSYFDVSDINTNITLMPNESKVFTVTAHGQKRGSGASAELRLNVDTEEDIDVPTVKLKLVGWDTYPLTLASNTITLSYGEEASVDIVHGSLNYELTSDRPHVFSANIGSRSTSGGGRYESGYSETKYIRIEARATAETSTLIVKDLDTGEETTLTVTVEGAYPGATAIDLGLPSGTKWASYNVGATKPEDFGGYYAWGETEEKANYDWSNYIHCDGTEDTCHDIGDDITGTQYDAAHVKWEWSSRTWQMPSLEQAEELINNCSHEVVTWNGWKKGIKFTGTNGNSIIIPFSGYGSGTSLYGQDHYGLCWLGRGNSTSALSYYLTFDESGNVEIKSSGSRYWGCTIRPVFPSGSDPDDQGGL